MPTVSDLVEATERIVCAHEELIAARTPDPAGPDDAEPRDADAGDAVAG
jgi:hypothetical protein